LIILHKLDNVVPNTIFKAKFVITIAFKVYEVEEAADIKVLKDPIEFNNQNNKYLKYQVMKEALKI
jgi:hypothetical protein